MAAAAAEVVVPDSDGRSVRARLATLPVMGGLLPVDRSRITADVIAGITLAAVSIPVALGYAKIAGMPVVTGLYTLLFPMAAFAVIGSSRHLVVGADSATAAILAAALGIRAPYGQWPPPVHTRGGGSPRVGGSGQRLQALRTTTPPATTATTAVPSSTRISAPKPYRPG
jgi:MFS superfamily sulfate permease-like transporter